MPGIDEKQIIEWLRKCPDPALSVAVYSFLTQRVDWDEERTARCGELAKAAYIEALSAMKFGGQLT